MPQNYVLPFVRSAVLASLCAAALSACGGSSTDSTAASTAPPPSSGSGGSSGGSGGGTTTTQPGTLQLNAASYSVNEGDGTVTITVSRTGGSDGAVGVSFATTPGSATAGSDYTTTSRTLSWAAGDSANKTVSIPIIDDSTTESDETFTVAISSPTGGASLGTQTSATVTIKDNDTASSPPASSNTQPIGYYTDLASAPVGAFVTAYGTGFGTSGTVTLGGTTQTVVSYSDTKVVFKVSGSGGALMVGTKSLGTLPVHTGRVREATASTLTATWSSVQPGDAIYLHAGTYTGNYGEATWTPDAQLDTFVQGTASQPIALVAYPGESVTFKSSQSHANFVFGDGNGHKARYITVAGLRVIGDSECMSAGGDTSTDTKPESGGEYIRVVANQFEITNATANTMTGLVSVQGDGWQILGNSFVDPANRVIINNNHVVYIQNGADDVEVAYNQFRNLHVGFVVQIHQDGNPMLYQNLNVHDNYFEAANYGDMRGVTTSNIQSTSTVTFANNTFRHLGGGGWGCINVYSGKVTVKGNDCQDTQNGLNVNGDTTNSRTITMDGNKLCPASGYLRINFEGGASAAQVTETNPVACN